ncbi:MAG: hypothetical protein KA807_13720, partial [Prolixibacteraceae bacterium]|nr:hypothetical protein [Prolixibacteraceae bacterium]
YFMKARAYGVPTIFDHVCNYLITFNICGGAKIRFPCTSAILLANFDFYRIKFFNLALTFFNLST